MSSDELIKSVDEKLSLLIKEREELRDIMFGEGGMIEDVKLIKMELIGNSDFKKEGLISMVYKHHEFYKKMQNMGSFALLIIALGGVAGTVGTFFAHKWDKIKLFFE